MYKFKKFDLKLCYKGFLIYNNSDVNKSRIL